MALLLASAALAAPAQAETEPVPGVDLIAEHGFGDRQNSYSWSMAWFKGKLYVGTGRNVMCVEGAVSQFYFKFQDYYSANPFLNVHCTPDEYDLDLRAEIWQHTPETNTWRRVFRSPADIPNPRARGKFLARDIAFRGMKVARDGKGRKALFISGVTSNEYVPEVARRHPPRLLRTYDGQRFHDISRPLVIKRSDGFPSRRPVGYRGLEVWNNHLYVLASTSLTGDGAVLQVRNPFGRKARFTQVTPPDMHVFELQDFNGALYVGTGSYATGYAVYRSTRKSTPLRFQPVVTDGGGLGAEMVSVVSMHPFKGWLYVGVVSWSDWTKGFPHTELIRIDPRGRWELVTGKPRSGPDGQTLAPISGLPPGFGNMWNAHIWRLMDQDGALYAGTLDLSWYFQESDKWAPEWSGLINSALNFEYGFDLWASCDGVSWFPMTRTAFGADPKFDFGVRGLAAGRGGFYVGSANHAFGTQIWHDRQIPCAGSQTRRAQAASAVRAPRDVLTDDQRDGTVLSWHSSGPGVTYRVERSEFAETSVTMKRPPNAFLDGMAPQDVGGPVDLTALVRTRATVVGTTTEHVFVDTTREPGKRYEYQVFAQARGRGRDLPSNVQVVPDPRPPATFAQLEDTAGTGGSVAALRPGRGTPRASTVGGLRRLARTSTDDAVRQLAHRLARRVQYEDLAGGPAGGG